MIETNCSVTVMPVHSGSIGFLRREEGDSYEAKLVAPGGKVELTDGELIDGVPYFSVEAAAVREMIEETSIHLSRGELWYFCSLTLPSGRVIISLYAELTDEQRKSAQNLLFLNKDEIEQRDDFAPGMKQEAVLLYDACGI